MQTQNDIQTQDDENTAAATIASVMLEGQLQDVTINDMLSIDPSQIDEVRGQVIFAEGIVQFRIKDFETYIADAKVPGTQSTRPTVHIAFNCEIIGYEKTKLPDVDVSSFLGRFHKEIFRIYNAREDSGRVKAFCRDIGVEGEFDDFGSFLMATHSREFVAPLSHNKYKDRSGNDRVACNMDREKIRKLEQA